ncbi:MAG: argininosuccinate lyase [Proteobacteria bacterium]|nr:MAG: argininosuccinate lyase [Pseudomonadota bacterium]
MQKMWAGRFSKKSARLLDAFNASLEFDRKLYKQDIQGSIAHATMLAKQDIISKNERDTLIDGLKKIETEIEKGEFVFDISDEDIHMAIEKRLTQLVGSVGGKLHTARSRNDQVALDFRLYVLQNTKSLHSLILKLIKTLLDMAKEHTDTLLPGMTHLQHAQPINFGFHLLAYAHMLKRDCERFESSHKRNNVLPLGCGALAGTPHPIDREEVAKLLGFVRVSENCLDTVSDRDFALEILFNISTLFMHISRLCEELVLWSSSEFGYLSFSDEYSTGSSIMPQKKNPDIPELMRGKTGRVYGNLMGLLTVMKGLPLAYNKDTQEDKEGVFDSVENAQISLKILNEALKSLSINKENMLLSCKKGHLSATDLADFLVSECKIPFREAHFITGKVVAKAESLGVDLSELEYKYIKEIDNRISKKVMECLPLEVSMNARDGKGGTSTASTLKQIESLQKWLDGLKF